jgi:hypothetical protein
MRFIFAAALISFAPCARADELINKVMIGVKADAKQEWNLARALQIFDKNGKAERTSFARLQNGKWTLVAFAGAKPDAEVTKSFNEQADAGKVNYPRYAKLEAVLLSSPIPTQDNATTAIYRVKKMPPGSFDFQGEDLSSHVEGEITVVKGDKPYVSRLRMFNAAPFKMSLAKVTTAEAVRLYALASDGSPVAVEETTKALANVLFKKITYHRKVTISEHKRVLPAK